MESLSNSELNKDTATYFILMKKLVKNNEKVTTYIGSDNFDPANIIKLIEKDANDSDTEIMSSPQTVLDSISGP